MNFLSAQIPVVLALQKLAFLAPLMKITTQLGSEEFFLLLVPLVYLCVDRRSGLRLGALVLTCDAFNILLKLGCALPRPYWISARVAQLATDASFGLPSSHAQNAVAIWIFLARTQKKYARIPVYFCATLLIVLISLSRVFLGVHFPLDILAGWICGALFLLGFIRFGEKIIARFAAQTLANQIALSLGAALILVALAFALLARGAAFPDAAVETFTAMTSRAGALCGLGIGAALAQRFARFEVTGNFARRAANFVFAFIGLLVCWRGLALIFPADERAIALAFRFFRYAMTTLWVSFGAPFLLLRWKKLETSPSRRAAEF